jgi:hypothetical protein
MRIIQLNYCHSTSQNPTPLPPAMNKLLCFFIPIVVFFLLCGLIGFNTYQLQQKIDSGIVDYYILEGLDYANGRHLIRKQLEDGTIIWTKTISPSAYEDIYAKYNLHHDKSILHMIDLTPYIKNYFIYYKTDGFTNFWNWKWYCFKDIEQNTTINNDDDDEIIYDFLVLLDNNDLPIEDVQKAHKEIVQLSEEINKEESNTDLYTALYEKRHNFIRKFVDSHLRLIVAKLIDDTIKNGTLPQTKNAWRTIAPIILKFRDDYPDNLPAIIFSQMASDYHFVLDDIGNLILINLVNDCQDVHPIVSATEDSDDLSDNSDDKEEDKPFFLYNYLLRPTEFNALHTILFETSDLEYSIHTNQKFMYMDTSYKLLKTHKLLDKFLSQVYIEDIVTPPLPDHLPKFYDDDVRDYTIDIWKNDPDRAKMLRMFCFPNAFKPYWQERLKKLKEKQKEQ